MRLFYKFTSVDASKVKHVWNYSARDDNGYVVIEGEGEPQLFVQALARFEKTSLVDDFSFPVQIGRYEVHQQENGFVILGEDCGHGRQALTMEEVNILLVGMFMKKFDPD